MINGTQYVNPRVELYAASTHIPRKFRCWMWKVWHRLPTSMRRRVYDFLTMLARKHWNGATTLYVTRLPFGVCIKNGFNAVEEVAATRYVEENTSVPRSSYPRLRFRRPSWISEDGSHCHAGRSRASSWGEGQSLTQALKITAGYLCWNTTRMVWTITVFASPGRIISGFQGGGFFSFRIRDTLEGLLGPYPSQHEFHLEDFCTPWASDSRRTQQGFGASVKN